MAEHAITEEDPEGQALAMILDAGHKMTEAASLLIRSMSNRQDLIERGVIETGDEKPEAMRATDPA